MSIPCRTGSAQPVRPTRPVRGNQPDQHNYCAQHYRYNQHNQHVQQDLKGHRDHRGNQDQHDYYHKTETALSTGKVQPTRHFLFALAYNQYKIAVEL